MSRNLMKNLAFILAWPLALCALSLTSCSSGADGDYATQLKQYFDKDVETADGTGAMSAYFDLSDGMVLAYKGNADAAGFLNATVQRLTSGDSTTVYQLADDKIAPLALHQTELYNKIMDEKSYSQQMAPIEKALGQIVKDGKSSLRVTDFEEFTPDHKVQHQSFATRYFVEWLKRGNDITFFVFDFVGARKLPYHLYFIVFDNKAHRLLGSIKDAVAGVKGYKEFHLSCDAYSVSTAYPSSVKGGNYHDAATGEDLVTGVLEDGSADAYKNYGEGVRMEYYPLGVSWADAQKNAQEAVQEGFDPKFTHLFRHLYFDFSNQDSYIIKKVALRVTDVEDDFNRYTEYKRIMADKEANADCFGPDGKLLPEYDYTHSTARPAEIKDMLVVDDNLFSSTLAKSAGRKVEIGINFAPTFGGNIVGGAPGDLYRVDVVVADSQPNIGPRIDELFMWGANNNLRDAVRNTLQMLNPKGTVIYSYFVRAL